MDCICLNMKNKIVSCHAQLIRPNENFWLYQPTEEDLKNFCRNPEKFPSCPRLIAFQKIGAT
jgi:hypothetical protein